MSNEQFIRLVHSLIAKCGGDKGKLFFVAHEVLDAMQRIEPASPPPGQ